MTLTETKSEIPSNSDIPKLPAHTEATYYGGELDRVGVGTDPAEHTVQPSQAAIEAIGLALGRNPVEDINHLNNEMELGFAAHDITAENPNAISMTKEITASIASNVAREIVDGPRPEQTARQELGGILTSLRTGTQKMMERAKLAGNVLLADDRGEAHPRLAAIGAVAAGLVIVGFVVGPPIKNSIDHANQKASLEASQKADDAQKAAIEKAATIYSPQEQSLGTFAITDQYPNVTQGFDHFVETHPDTKVSPSELNLGKYNTIDVSGVALGSVSVGDKIEVEKEKIDGKEVVVTERALPGVEPLSPDGTIPAPQTH